MNLGDDTNYTKQVAMTLAEIAYCDPDDLAAQLAYPYYATKCQWKLAWLGATDGNLMYVCRNKTGSQWCVVVRGSMTDPETEAFWIDWFEQDLVTLAMVDLPFGSNYNNGAQIAWGTLQGFEDLQDMQDVNTGTYLVDFLKANVPIGPASIVVIGHSLGGCLSSVLAPYLYEELCRSTNQPVNCIIPVTFAAPTAGDNNFAAYSNSLSNNNPYRCLNDLDVVPHSWSLDGLNWTMNSYSPSPVIDDFMWGLVDSTWWLLYEGSYDYTQPGPGNVNAGTLQNYYWWFEEAGHQHSGNTYLRMYGAPTVHAILPNAPTITTTIRRGQSRPSVAKANEVVPSASPA